MHRARVTRRLPIAASAAGLFGWAGIGLIVGRLDTYTVYDWVNVNPAYLIAAAYVVATLQTIALGVASRRLVRLSAAFAAAFYFMLTTNIATADLGAPSWGLCLPGFLINLAILYAPGITRDDRFAAKRGPD